LHFLVMEYVEGTTLTRVVQRKGALPVEFACNYIRQAALGLQHAFEKDMVHRDLKPQNLMLTPKGQIKILDFGMARFVTDAETGSESHEMVMGTPDYISPEQATSSRLADIRSDIYSLGCTLYFLLTGRPPFPEGNVYEKLAAHKVQTARKLTEIRADIPVEVVILVERMLAKDPKDRPQTPDEVARILLPLSKAGTASVVLRVAQSTVVPDGATEMIRRPANDTQAKAPAPPETTPLEKSRPTSRYPRRKPRRRSFFERYGYLIVLAFAGTIVIGALITAGMMMQYQINKQMPQPPAKQK